MKKKKGDQKREIIKKCMTSGGVMWMYGWMDGRIGCNRGGTFCAEELQRKWRAKTFNAAGLSSQICEKQTGNTTNSKDIFSVGRKCSGKIF